MQLDRRFSSMLTREDWVGMAEEMKRDLTDEAIAEALAVWPAPIHALAAEDMTRTLQARRDQLPEVANSYYNVLADVIDVVGSHKRERFVVNRIDDDHTEVIMYKMSKSGEARMELYRRTIWHDETREIRI